MGKFKKLLLDMEVEPLIAYGVDVDKAEAANSVDCTVVFPRDNQLQLDLDTDESIHEFEERLKWLSGLMQDVIGCNKPSYQVSRSGNTHCTIDLLVPVTDERRILLQALLGSDVKRECLGLVRLHHLGASKSCLFRPNTPMFELSDACK